MPTVPVTITDPDELAVATIRTLAMDAVQAANSGHPGTPIALAPVAYTLWQRRLQFDPADPIWPNRDRFVLSEGHASALLWALLYLSGVRAVDPDYEVEGRQAVTLEDLRTFRDRLHIPIPDSQLDKYLPPYYHPGPDDPRIQYMMERRAALGGSLPRRQAVSRPLPMPPEKTYDIVTRGSGKQEVATTMAFVRLFKDLTRDPEIGYRFVP